MPRANDDRLETRPSASEIRRTRRRLGGRIGAGLAGIALAGASLWAVEVAPLPTVEAGPVAVVLSPVPGDQARVCQGPLALLGQSASDPSALGYKGYAEVAEAGSFGDLTVKGMRPGIETGATPAAPTLTATGVPALFEAPGIVGDRATSLTIAQSVALSGTGAAGFAAAPCRQPSADQWLVGGSTTPGASTVLSLVNPTNVTATVRVALHGTNGPLPTRGLDGIQVPAGAQVAVPLEGIAPAEAGFVAHLTTRGSAVSAALHEVHVDGLASQGFEIVPSTRAPSTRLNIVGVPFPTTSNEEDESVFAARGATLRLFAPGGEPASATITLRDAAGTELEPLELTLQPGVVSDVPLGAYPIGRYSVTVTATAPVVGALRTALVSGPLDFAWYLPSVPIDGQTGIAVPPGPGPRLHLANTSDVGTVVRFTDGSAAPREISISAGATVSIDITGGGTYALEALGDVAASITYDGPGQMAGIPVVSGSPLAADVTVYR